MCARARSTQRGEAPSRRAVLVTAIGIVVVVALDGVRAGQGSQCDGVRLNNCIEHLMQL